MYISTLSGESYYIIRQEACITIRQKILHYQGASLLHYQAMLLHYQAVITLSDVFITLSAVITLTGDYYIIGCNLRQHMWPARRYLPDYTGSRTYH